MEKIKVKGISKSEFRSCYTFEKTEGFFEFVREFVCDLGPDAHDYGKLVDEYYDPINGTAEKIEEWNDRLDNFSDDEYSIDVIAFRDCMKIVVNSREDKQEEISRKLDKYVCWE